MGIPLLKTSDNQIFSYDGSPEVLPESLSTPQKDPAMFVNNSYSASHVPVKSNSTEKRFQFILLTEPGAGRQGRGYLGTQKLCGRSAGKH